MNYLGLTVLLLTFFPALIQGVSEKFLKDVVLDNFEKLRSQLPKSIFIPDAYNVELSFQPFQVFINASDIEVTGIDNFEIENVKLHNNPEGYLALTRDPHYDGPLTITSLDMDIRFTYKIRGHYSLLGTHEKEPMSGNGFFTIDVDGVYIKISKDYDMNMSKNLLYKQVFGDYNSIFSNFENLKLDFDSQQDIGSRLFDNLKYNIDDSILMLFEKEADETVQTYDLGHEFLG